MNKKYKAGKTLNLDANDQTQHEQIQAVCHALSTTERIKILQSLSKKPKNLSELSSELDLPISSVSRHIDALVNSGLVNINYQPGTKGQTKICYQAVSTINLSLSAHKNSREKNREFIFGLPLGLYSECLSATHCGMVGKSADTAVFDNPDAFFSPERVGAECLFLGGGHISYNFPSQFARKQPVCELSFSFETCFENNFYDERSLTVLVNDIEVATVTAPGNFTQRRGRFTPDFWPSNTAQFGALKTVTITDEGVFVDGNATQNSLTIADLGLKKSQSVKLTLQAKKDTYFYVFGESFGDYPQAIIMKMR